MSEFLVDPAAFDASEAAAPRDHGGADSDCAAPKVFATTSRRCANESRLDRAQEQNRGRGVAVLVAGPPSHTDALASALRDIGCVVRALENPALLIESCSTQLPDAVVITVNSHQRSASLAAAKWVCHNLGAPTIVVTEPADVDARVQAITFEADATVGPLDPSEAVARVASLVKRNRQHAVHQRWSIGDLRIDPTSRRVTRRGEAVPLTARELDVLLTLIEHRGHAVTKSELLDQIWQKGPRTVNAVEAQVSGLRRKLHAHGPPLIHTVYGQGYSFRAVPDEPAQSQTDPLAERERLLREREEAVARRAKLLRSLERAAGTR